MRFHPKSKNHVPWLLRFFFPEEWQADFNAQYKEWLNDKSNLFEVVILSFGLLFSFLKARFIISRIHIFQKIKRLLYLFFSDSYIQKLENYLLLVIKFFQMIWFNFSIVIKHIIKYIQVIKPDSVYQVEEFADAAIIEDLEQRFRKDYSRSFMLTVRYTLIASIISVIIFGYLDLYTLPLSYQLSWIIRTVICLTMLMTIILTYYQDKYEKWCQWSNSFVILITGAGFSTMVALAQPEEIAYNSYYIGLLLTLIGNFFFINLRFTHALLTGIIIVLVYEYVALFDQHLLSSEQTNNLFINNNFFLITCFLLCSVACNLYERAARMEFLTRFVITEKFLELYNYLEQFSPSAPEILKEINNMRQSPTLLKQFLLRSLIFVSKNEIDQRFLGDAEEHD